MYASTIVVALAAAGAMASPAPIQKRASCTLTNYPDVTLGPLNDAIGYFNQAASETFTASNGCTVTSCSYGTGVVLCADGGSVTRTKGDMATDLQAIMSECGVSGDDGTRHTAMQQFYDGYNVLLQGGYSC